VVSSRIFFFSFMEHFLRPHDNPIYIIPSYPEKRKKKERYAVRITLTDW